MLGRRSRATVALGLVLAGALTLGGTASATFPGEDGRISFARFTETGSDLWTVKPDGSDPMQLTDLGEFSVFSDWSPDGRKVAFDSNSTGPVKAFVIGADGSNARQFADIFTEDFDPAWTPSGRKLVLDADSGEGDQGLFVVPFLKHRVATLADARRVTENRDGTVDSEPQVSPDGRWIAFVRFSPACLEGPVGCETAIYKVRRNGRRLTQLTPVELNASAPDWSPDGRWIIFDTGDSGVAPDVGDIRVMKADGSHMKTLLDGDAANYFQNPSFSPSGKHFTFNRFDATVAEPQPEVWTADADGSDTEAIATSPFGDFKPDWGPKAKKRHDDEDDKDDDKKDREHDHHDNEDG